MVAEHGCSAASFVDAIVPPILEEIVKVVKTVLQEQISGRIRTQIGDVHVSLVVEPETSSRDRSLQCTVEQSLDVPVPEMVRQLVEAPKTVPQDRIRQRTVEQIVDTPSSARCGGTGRGLQGFSSGQSSTEFRRPDHRNSCCFTR